MGVIKHTVDIRLSAACGPRRRGLSACGVSAQAVCLRSPATAAAAAAAFLAPPPAPVIHQLRTQPEISRGIDLPPCSSHRSASPALTRRHAARLPPPPPPLLVYMAPPVGRCIISTAYLQVGMTAAPEVRRRFVE